MSKTMYFRHLKGEDKMKNILSRRDFMVKNAIVLGAVVITTGSIGTGEIKVCEALASEGSKEKTMPHISVKLWPGRSEETKQRLADAIVEDVLNIIGGDETSVSVSIEEVPSTDWKEEVYDPEIRDKRKYLYKKPGYSM
jgi:4-oxalocrotonate tautomerase